MMANILGVPGKATLGVPDYAKAIRSGLENFIKANEAQYAPQMSQQDLQQKMYENVTRGAEAQYAPEMAELGVKLKRGEVDRMPFQQQLLQAQIAKALRPPEAKLSNYEKALEGYSRIVQKYGENSREAQEAKGYASRLAQGASGINLSVDPKTGVVNFSQGGRNQPMSQVVTDEQGNSYLVNKPTTPTATATQKGSLANFVRENMAENFNNPYVGTGANKQLIQDRWDYDHETDPIKKKEIGERLINGALSLKLVPEYASLQLAAQGVTPSVESNREQKKALTQGYAEGLELVSNNLPRELQQEVNKRHDKTIKELSKKRNEFVAKGMPIQLDQSNKSQPTKKEENVIDYIRDASGRFVPANRG